MPLLAFMTFTTRDSAAASLVWGAAMGAVILLVGVDRPSWAPAPAPACPGLADAVAATVARLAPSLAISSIVGALNATALVVACAAFAIMARPLSGWLGVAAALSMAATTPALGRGALVSAALPFAGACLALRATHPRSNGETTAHRAGALALWLALAAACVPTTAGPFCLGGALATWMLLPNARASARLALTGAHALIVLAAGALGLTLVTPLPGLDDACRVATVGGWSVTSLGVATAQTLRDVGPSVMACLVLGVIYLRGRVPARAAAAALILASAAALAASGRGVDGVRALGVAAALGWLLVAVGVHAVLTYSASTRWRAAAMLVVLTMIGTHHARAIGSGRDASPSSPLKNAPASAMRDVSAALPRGASVVIEDGLGDVLWRSVRDTKGLRHVAASRAAVAGALTRTGVFALPGAQARLQRLGFITSPTSPAVEGVARIAVGGECVAPGAEWRQVTVPAASNGISLAVEGASGRGPVVIYLSFLTAPAIQRREWPLGLERGLFLDRYDPSSTSLERNRLAAQAAADHLDPGAAVLAGPHVVRVELWRTTRAPLVLPIAIDGPPQHAVVKLHEGAPAGPLLVCPTFVTPIGQASWRR